MGTELYDSIGRTYSSRRENDPRIAAAIEAAIDGCDSILNVGAGTGSYEPAATSLVAVEPSRTMIAQRPRAYLDPLVRASISTFSRIGDLGANLARLEADIDSGAWERRYSDLQHLSVLDLGYRLVIARSLSASPKIGCVPIA